MGLLGLGEDARAAMAPFQGYLCDETLCTALLWEDDGAPWDRRQTVKIEGQSVRLQYEGRDGTRIDADRRIAADLIG